LGHFIFFGSIISAIIRVLQLWFDALFVVILLFFAENDGFWVDWLLKTLPLTVLPSLYQCLAISL